MRILRAIAMLVMLVLLSACSRELYEVGAPNEAPPIDTKVEQPVLPNKEVFRAATCFEVDHIGPGESRLIVEVASNRATGSVQAEVEGAVRDGRLAGGLASISFPINSYGQYDSHVLIDRRPAGGDSIQVGPSEVVCDIVAEAADAGFQPGIDPVSTSSPAPESGPAFVAYIPMSDAGFWEIDPFCLDCWFVFVWAITLIVAGAILFRRPAPQVQVQIIEPTIDLIPDLPPSRLDDFEPRGPEHDKTFVDELTDTFDQRQRDLARAIDDELAELRALMDRYNESWAKAMTATDAYLKGVNGLAEPLGQLWKNFENREWAVAWAGKADFGLQMVGPLTALAKASGKAGKKILDALADAKAKGTAHPPLPPTQALPHTGPGQTTPLAHSGPGQTKPLTDIGPGQVHTGPGQTEALPHTGAGQTQILKQPTGTDVHTGGPGLPPTKPLPPGGAPGAGGGPSDALPGQNLSPIDKADTAYIEVAGAGNQLEDAIKKGLGTPEFAAKLHKQYTNGLNEVKEALEADPDLWSKMFPEQAEYLQHELAHPKGEGFWSKLLGTEGPAPGTVQDAVSSTLAQGHATTQAWTQHLAPPVNVSDGGGITKAVADIGKQAVQPPGLPAHSTGILDTPTSKLDDLAAATVKDPSFLTVGQALMNINDTPITMLTSEYQTSKIKDAQQQFLQNNAGALDGLTQHRTALRDAMWEMTSLLGGAVPGGPQGATTPAYGQAVEILKEKQGIYDEAMGELKGSSNWIPGETEEMRARQQLMRQQLETFAQTGATQLGYDAAEVKKLESVIESLNAALYGTGGVASATSDAAHTLNGLKAGPERPETPYFFSAVRDFLLTQKRTIDAALAK